VARASLKAQTQRVNMAVRWLQQERSSEAIVSGLVARWSISRRQAYRYVLQAQSRLELRPLPAPKTIFTVNLPRPLIQAVRARCRRQGLRLSHVVEELLEQWLKQPLSHG
jgi:hypothetical protein